MSLSKLKTKTIENEDTPKEMEKMKKIVASMILGTMIISTATMSFANAKPMEKIAMTDLNVATYTDTFDGDYDDFDCETESFTEYMGELLAKVSSTDKDLMQKHYEAARQYEDDGKYDDAEKEWTAFEKVMEKYEKEFNKLYLANIPTYSEFIKESSDMLKAIDKASNTKLETLYKDAVKLEKAEKYDDAIKSWDAFYEIFDKFLKDNYTEGFEGEELDAIELEVLSFDDFMKESTEFLKLIPATELTQLKKHYEAAELLVKAEKYEDAEKEYVAFDKLFDQYLKEDMDFEAGDFEMPTYKEFMTESSEWLKAITADDAKSLEALYNKANTLDKEGNYEEAEEEWEAFEKLLDTYLK